MGYYKNLSIATGGSRKVIDVDASQVVKVLKNLAIENSIPKKDRKKILREAAKPLRKAVQEGFRGTVQNDPRKAVQGVKTSIYRNGMGANVSLHDAKAGRSAKVVRASITRTGGASGILRHRKRSRRTEQIDGYWGKDRAFILRFLNEGTQARLAFTREKSKRGLTANRGSLSSRGFFRRSVDGAKVTAEKYLADQLNSKLAASAKEGGAQVKK